MAVERRFGCDVYLRLTSSPASYVLVAGLQVSFPASYLSGHLSACVGHSSLCEPRGERGGPCPPLRSFTSPFTSSGFPPRCTVPLALPSSPGCSGDSQLRLRWLWLPRPPYLFQRAAGTLNGPSLVSRSTYLSFLSWTGSIFSPNKPLTVNTQGKFDSIFSLTLSLTRSDVCRSSTRAFYLHAFFAHVTTTVTTTS